ncbi:hypothetical protein RSAG8_08568, partial [Rhizoctonia solani AG-8 WAC10335]
MYSLPVTRTPRVLLRWQPNHRYTTSYAATTVRLPIRTKWRKRRRPMLSSPRLGRYLFCTQTMPPSNVSGILFRSLLSFPHSNFTKYGPNNVHRAIQAAWTRSPDGTYFQPSPDGKLYSFAKGGLLSYVPTYPLIVAVFDAVYLPTRRDPILLLQPTPKLSDLSSSRSADMDIPDVTYIGRIDDSLFALGHTNYPLVLFAQVGKKQLPRIDDGGKTPHSYSPPDPSSSVERCYDLDCLTGTKWSQTAGRSGLNRLLEEDHVLAIGGSAGVEDPPEDYTPDIPDPPRTRAQPQKQQTLEPRPTRTTNSTSHARPVVEDKTPQATPSPRSGIRGIAREWLAAWASMGGVVLSTVMFGLGLGVRRGKLSVAAILFKLLGIRNDKTSVESEPELEPVVEEEEDETPPPVPPKPHSISRISHNPYLMTTDSRPGVPSKDSPATPPRKRIRPRMRGGIPSSASVPANPAGQLAAFKSAGDVRAEGVVEESESNVENQKPEPENTETEVEGPVEEANTPGKKRVRRGRRGKARGKGASTGDANRTGPETEGIMSEGSESFVRVEKTISPPKSSLQVSEEVLGMHFRLFIETARLKVCTRRLWFSWYSRLQGVDVFALGCLFFYVLSGGDHAYGDRFERDVPFLRDEKRLGWLERLGEEGFEAIGLIENMLSPDPKKRPDTTKCLIHPFFWTPGRRLTFLQDASDRFEIMERDPREPGLVALETGAAEIIGNDWQRRLDKMFIDNLGKFRKYDVTSVQDLLRALRNKKNHYQDLPDNVKRHLGPLPQGFLSYFTRRFPKLFLHVYCVVEDSPLKVEPMFRSYFALEE